MNTHQRSLTFTTQGRGTYELTDRVHEVVQASDILQGLCHAFIHHTSASLMITENADPDVRRDLEGFLARLVVDGDPLFDHRAEGPDDMSAHIRSVLTQTSVSVPVTNGRLALGTWQGLYLYEHRTHPHERRITVTVMGSA